MCDIDELHRCCRGRRRLVKVRHSEGGATMLPEDDEFMKDPVFNALHEFGRYGKKVASVCGVAHKSKSKSPASGSR